MEKVVPCCRNVSSFGSWYVLVDTYKFVFEWCACDWLNRQVICVELYVLVASNMLWLELQKNAHAIRMKQSYLRRLVDTCNRYYLVHYILKIIYRTVNGNKITSHRSNIRMQYKRNVCFYTKRYQNFHDDLFIPIRNTGFGARVGRMQYLFIHGTWVAPLWYLHSNLINMYKCYRPDEDLCIFRCALITVSPSTFHTLNQNRPVYYYTK